jgi:hypothetical protein
MDSLNARIEELQKMIDLTQSFMENLEKEKKFCILKKYKLCGDHEWIRDSDNGSNCGESIKSFVCKKCNIDSWSVQHVT